MTILSTSGRGSLTCDDCKAHVSALLACGPCHDWVCLACWQREHRNHNTPGQG